MVCRRCVGDPVGEGNGCDSAGCGAELGGLNISMYIVVESLSSTYEDPERDAVYNPPRHPACGLPGAAMSKSEVIRDAYFTAPTRYGPASSLGGTFLVGSRHVAPRGRTSRNTYTQ